MAVVKRAIDSRKLVSAAAIVCLLVSLAPAVDAAVTCGDVFRGVAPCVGYLTSSLPSPPPGCCNGVKTLNSKARTSPDRQAACRCLKNLAGSIRGLNFGKAAGIPGKCGVNVGFPISLSTDCNKVR